jgi:hypothetical protein
MLRTKKVSVNPYPNIINPKVMKHRLNEIREKNREHMEAEHEDDILAFNDLTSLESQMQSLKTKGFLRAYSSYTPPSDLLPRFLTTCSNALGTPVELENLHTHLLANNPKKFDVLQALGEEFSHTVHSSRLHEMTNLDRVFLFYKSPVSTLNPYEQLHRDYESGLLPPNLVIQLDPVRFTGKGDHPLDQVTAFPRTDSFVTDLYAKEKYGSVKASHTIWEETDYK